MRDIPIDHLSRQIGCRIRGHGKDEQVKLLRAGVQIRMAADTVNLATFGVNDGHARRFKTVGANRKTSRLRPRNRIR